MKDLPEVKWEGIKDQYERFEKSLPFGRIKIETMMEKIGEAEKAQLSQDGGAWPGSVEPYVTLQTLR